MPTFKQKIVHGVGNLGAYKLIRSATRNIPKILMYHRFSEKKAHGYVHLKMFERQVNYLNRYFNVIKLSSLINYIRKDMVIPDNAVVITVDDGYHDFYDIAYPVLKQYNMPATFFVTTRFVDGDFWLWPDYVRFIIDNSIDINLQGLPGSFDSKIIHLDDKSRKYIWKTIIDYLLSIDDKKKWKWLDLFADRHGVSVPKCPVERYKAVNWDQIKEMHANNIEIGAHSRTHPSLARLQEDEFIYEIKGCFDDIVEHIGCRPISFCYPNGQPYDYTDTIKRYVENVGFLGSVTAFYDYNVIDDIYGLRRFRVSEDWFEFMKAVNGIEALNTKILGKDNIIKLYGIANQSDIDEF